MSRTAFFDELLAVRSALATDKPTHEKWNDLREHLSDPDVSHQAWNLLQSADWIPHLRAAGHFDHPPTSIKDNRGGIRYPKWSASKYLARVASEAPRDVLAIFEALPMENASVVADMVDAAVAMPGSYAAKLVPAIQRAMEQGTLWLSFQETSELCARLASEGYIEPALALADSIFGSAVHQGGRDRGQRDEYWYKEGLTKVIPPLAGNRPAAFLPMICGWLRSMIASDKTVDTTNGTDFSYIWRPAIEEHEQNRDGDFAAAMVGFAREAFEIAIERGGITLQAALALLAHERYSVFKRLRVHLLNVFADRDPSLAREAMMDRLIFDDPQFVHEYATLMSDHFDALTPQQQGDWLAWIEQGPDMSHFDALFREQNGREPAQTDRDTRIHYWQFKRLHWIQQHLDGKWKQLHDEMLARHGEPELSDLNVRFGPVSWGHETPFKLEELKGLPFSEIVEKVNAWTPDEPRGFGPEREGLALTFGQLIDDNPEERSRQAAILRGRHPMFVRKFIERMSDAIKASKDVDVAKLLELCEWVIAQPVEQQFAKNRRAGALEDTDWQWTRNSISRLIRVVCQAEVGEAPRFPLDPFRPSVARLLQSLTRDAIASNLLEDLHAKDPRTHDYFTMAINAPRGMAVEALLDFARWIGLHKQQEMQTVSIVPGGFDSMPEVREMLEWQIARDNVSYAASACLGAHLNTLYWLDKNWLRAHANHIFDLSEIDPQSAFGWAAWNALMVWGRPHIEFYELLQSQFARAVDGLGKVTLPSDTGREQPVLHLGEQLMILYGRGQVTLDHDEGLIRRFILNTAPPIRQHTIQFVGSSLRGEEKVAPDVIDRFMKLWEWYWDAIGQRDAERNARSSVFGWWFVCRQFPEKWSLEQLDRFATVVPMPEPDDLIIQRLVEIASLDIARATMIVDNMARRDTDGWRVSSWRRDAKSILSMAMSGPLAVRGRAEQLIDFFGRKGFLEFGELLAKSI